MPSSNQVIWVHSRYVGGRIRPQSFRPPFGIKRNPVPYGRFYVRQLTNGRWMVWSNGKYQKPRKTTYFDTFDQAIKYAHVRAGKTYGQFREQMARRGYPQAR